MPQVKVTLDHCVVHVSDWECSNAFYRDVLGAELVRVGAGWAYRFGAQQLNLHGPGVEPAPVARLPVQPGNSDLCFVWPGPVEEAVAHLSGAASRSSLGQCHGTGRAGAGRASTSATRTGRCWSSSLTAKVGSP